jgi:hypothetical protein
MAHSVNDRLVRGWIAGGVRRYAARGVIDEDMRPIAVADIRATARGRGDLLADQAGVSLGFALTESEPKASIRRLGPLFRRRRHR